jgi:chromosomal replication initiator protein
MENPTHTLWETCLRTIRNNIAEDKFKTWFAPIQIVSYQENVLRFGLPNEFFHEYLVQHYGNLLYTVIKKVFGEDIRLEYCLISANTDKNNKPVVKHSEKEKVATESKKVTPAEETPRIDDLNSQLNYNYNFDNFIEGESNKLPRSVGQAIAEHPKQSTFNPLFIYGPSGVGKTHLVNAIGTKIKELHPTKRVLYVTSHLFQVQYTDSVRKNTVNDFINFYQTIDVLIIDDVQEFATLSKSQNTFFHIFNHLHQNGKQLILTSDRAPAALQGMEERLLTRFKWGLLAELEKPNKELRYDILRSKIRREGLKIPKEVIDLISENINDSVRELEGVVNSLMAHSVVLNREIDIQLAEKILKFSVKTEKEPITIDHILKVVCNYFDVEMDDILSASRKQPFVQARQVAMYLASKYTNLSSGRIGILIGNRNHATVLHSCKTVEDSIHVDKSFKAKMEEITKLLKKRQK